ncbi:MAG TPA: amino acid permease [Chitinophagaceae bacterium]|nr:amino acid permease [Chitinophagaceae bacterium]MCC6634117.1 amino acid permease [Chitinophagaceae bacterium]HMZ46067.1 amino acid permease [Chitinophagaceae bacterium]HNF29364.1 amino acid permease [Chitinophagaceae bacterium]HNJ57811.1 amino acid permease [Chitinophagaceae bacterium]
MSLFRKKSLDKINIEFTESHHQQGLKRVLNVKDLTFMGIAAVVGAGIFSTIGKASFDGGPGVVFLFLITAVTCGFSALCYAEFAGRVPISGSAYTYAYVSFGEIIAWIIGWALILEYAIGNIVVAISWSGYFDNLLQGLGVHLPKWLLADPFTASETFKAAIAEQASGKPLSAAMQEAINIYNSAPIIAGKHIFFNLPAFIIVVLITLLAYVGIKESKKSANYMVIFKIAVIIFIIVMGFFYVDAKNWNPFLPNGFGGVLAGVSAVFYAYIGFDAISTTAEECKNPQRDLPKGMIYSLLICTVLYILIALVLTGMVNYTELNVTDPLAFVFEKLGLHKIGYIISISAVVATTSVLLVFQLGQPRIWMSMSRDGLLPKRFAKVHPKFGTPSFATIVTGLLVGIPTLIMPADLVTDLTSIGTLFAFVLVCLGVLVLPKLSKEQTKGRFRLPYINGKFIIPALVILFIWFTKERIENSFLQIGSESYHEILFLIFILISVVIAVFSFIKNYSLIPIIGALCCMYLMIEIPAESWIWFFVWMAIGLSIYFMYGRKRSRLNNA